MPTLSLTRNYEDGTLLLADDFDVFLNEIELLLNTTKLSDTNIQDDGITISQKITSATITTSKILDANITTAKVADSAITTAKILADNITTAKIVNSAVTTAKIADSAVTTAKIANESITEAKRSPANYAVSSAASSSTASTGEHLIGSITLTTTGRPVMLFLQSTGDSSASYVEIAYSHSDLDAYTRLELKAGFYRNASIISYSEWADNTIQQLYSQSADSEGRTSFRLPPSIFAHIDTPSAGTHTYTVYLNNNTATRRIAWNNVRLVGMEI